MNSYDFSAIKIAALKKKEMAEEQKRLLSLTLNASQLERIHEHLKQLHEPAREHTGPWWRSECPAGCRACSIEYIMSGEENK